MLSIGLCKRKSSLLIDGQYHTFMTFQAEKYEARRRRFPRLPTMGVGYVISCRAKRVDSPHVCPRLSITNHPSTHPRGLASPLSLPTYLRRCGADSRSTTQIHFTGISRGWQSKAFVKPIFCPVTGHHVVAPRSQASHSTLRPCLLPAFYLSGSSR